MPAKKYHERRRTAFKSIVALSSPPAKNITSRLPTEIEQYNLIIVIFTLTGLLFLFFYQKYKIMADIEEFYSSIIQRIFSNWTGLRMVVEHGVGSKEHVIDFCSYIGKFIYINENLSTVDLADELEEYMDTEFQTRIEDGSAQEVAEKLMKFYHYCCVGNLELAETEINKSDPLQSWILSRDEIKQRNINSQTVNNDSDTDEENDTSMETVDSKEVEWVKVQTKKKRK